MTGQDWLEKDFYGVLGVDKDASANDIKKAYRKLARTLHPDAKPGDAAAEQRFKEVGEAYAVLSDPEQREQYDAVRAMAGGARFTAGPGGQAGFEDLFGGLFGGGAGAPGGTRVRFTTGGPAGAPGGQAGFEDLLGGLFGGGYEGYGAPRGPRPGQDVQATTTLPFRDAVTGSTVTLRTADGRTVTARIPAGVKDGQRIRLRGKGQPGEDGAPAGDLVITVSVAPHPVFTREGDNLKVTVPVSFPEAALGAQVPVPTLDGGTVRVKVPPGTPSGRTLRVRGRGVKTKNATGDLLVTVQVAVPQRLNHEAREAVEAFQAAVADADPRAELLAKAREA
jgi:molecular chaperone DnaJ